MKLANRGVLAFLGLGVAGLGLCQLHRQLRALSFQAPPPQYQVVVECHLRIPMPDGATLMADRYSPQANGEFPTILIRTPYGRPPELGLFNLIARFSGLADDSTYRLFAERGYHVVVQSVRGRFLSDGEFDPFVNEAHDGTATIDWISRQEWFNGTLGLWGPSYLGYVQWAVAAAAPAYLKAILPMMTSARMSRAIFPDDAYSMDTAVRWTYLVNAMQGPSKRFDLIALMRTAPFRQVRALRRAFAHTPTGEVDRVILGKPVSFYRIWMENANLSSPYWRSIDKHKQLSAITAPVHLIAGWYDIFLRDQLIDYTTLLASGRKPYLTIGPQTHSAMSVIEQGVREGLSWFDAHLKGQQERVRQRPVRVYVMGAHEWHEMDFWPPLARTTRYYLHAHSQLATVVPSERSSVDQFTFDPLDPTPVVGGPMLNEGNGPRDHRGLEMRPDVLTYTTPPLTDDVDVIGPVRLELYTRSSLPHTDFIGRLCNVYPDGRSINVCDGLFRVLPGKGERQPDGSLRIDIDMWATAQRFRRGHCIRLQVVSGAHPRWERNLGSGEPIGKGVNMLRAEQLIYRDAAHPSALVLPIINPSDSSLSSRRAFVG